MEDREALLAQIATLQAQLAVAESITAGAPMVSAYRGYINRRKGNEHSRVVDVAAESPDEAQTKILEHIKKSEVLEQIVSITVSREHELV